MLDGDELGEPVGPEDGLALGKLLGSSLGPGVGSGAGIPVGVLDLRRRHGFEVTFLIASRRSFKYFLDARRGEPEDSNRPRYQRN